MGEGAWHDGPKRIAVRKHVAFYADEARTRLLMAARTRSPTPTGNRSVSSKRTTAGHCCAPPGTFSTRDGMTMAVALDSLQRR
jgi:hypothetical protein